MKIIGTKKEIEFMQETIINTDHQCDNCPFVDYCNENKCDEISCSQMVCDAIEFIEV